MSAYQYQYSNKVGLEWVIKNMPDYLFPDLSKKKDRINKPFSGVIATLDKHPVGLLLASFDNHGKSARLHSFVVNPQHRKRGVGSAMWSTMEESLTSAGRGSNRRILSIPLEKSTLPGKNTYCARLAISERRSDYRKSTS